MLLSMASTAVQCNLYCFFRKLHTLQAGKAYNEKIIYTYNKILNNRLVVGFAIGSSRLLPHIAWLVRPNSRS